MANFTKVRRRSLLRGAAAATTALAAPTIFTSKAWAAGYTNEPKGSTVTLGFNVPQTGAYADEGADELRAYQLAVEHINGEGDGGMLNTFSSKALTGAGVNGKKVVFVTGDTQTKSDAARASARVRSWHCLAAMVLAKPQPFAQLHALDHPNCIRAKFGWIANPCMT